ncbi:hypothetical protein Tco_0518599, partial [Tanacetum coccineum]
MITINNRIEDKKPSELILPPMDMLETFLLESKTFRSGGL